MGGYSESEKKDELLEMSIQMLISIGMPEEIARYGTFEEKEEYFKQRHPDQSKVNRQMLGIGEYEKCKEKMKRKIEEFFKELERDVQSGAWN